MRNVITLLLAVTFFLTATSLRADLIEIDFVHPVQKESKPNKPTVIPLQAFSGWPITIELTMNNELGIASHDGGEGLYFPLNENPTGYVVFSDPDECLVLNFPNAPDNWPFPSGPTCSVDSELVITESDETYFEFSVDSDGPGIPDDIGNPERIAALVDATSGRPTIDPNVTGAVPIGPPTSNIADEPDPPEEIVDGYGYGADDDIPGLVIISRHGPGIAYEDSGIAKAPLELRNLAGFTRAVNYELNNTKGKTTINAQLTVPGFLIAPVVVADDAINQPPGELKDVLWRIDGSTTIVSATEFLGREISKTFEIGYPALAGHFVYTVSAMAVSGVAPNTVIDMNGDDEIDGWDLELMGYQVLGQKKSFSVRLFPAQACHGGSGGIWGNTVFADLDGNGQAIQPIVCPAGPGSISKPPR